MSIVLVSWNTRALLLRALREFLPLQTVGGEVIVVDNASSDGSADAVEAEFPEVHVLRSARNLGFGGGANLGIRSAREPFVLILNSDTVVKEGVVEALVGYALARPTVGILGPRLLNEDGSPQISYFRFPSVPDLFLAATGLNKIIPGSSLFSDQTSATHDRRGCGRVDAVPGCCLMIRRHTLERIGSFDEDYFMYAEEIDLCFRAWRAGFEVHYAPVGEVVHTRGASSQQVSRSMFLEFRRSMLRFFRLHRGAMSSQLARVLLILFLVVRLPHRAVRALGRRAESSMELGNYLAGIVFLLRPLRSILRRIDH